MNREPMNDRTARILAQRVTALDAISGPRCGDYVEFADGVTMRVSHIWDQETPAQIQTSHSGSWYIGDGYVSFSGSLYSPVPSSTLTLTEETRSGLVWLFRDDYQCADNGVHALISFRVYKSSAEAPKS